MRSVQIKVINWYLITIVPPAVPCVEDQPNPEVGGGVERAGLSRSHCLVCRPGGERPFPQVLTFGICLPFHTDDVTVGFEIAVLCQRIHGKADTQSGSESGLRSIKTNSSNIV